MPSNFSVADILAQNLGLLGNVPPPPVGRGGAGMGEKPFAAGAFEWSPLDRARAAMRTGYPVVEEEPTLDPLEAARAAIRIGRPVPTGSPLDLDGEDLPQKR